MSLLTKSKYLTGLDCPKYFWRTINHPETIPKASVSDEFRFEQGNEVGELAKKLFPEGIDLPTSYRENIEQTRIHIKSKKPLFEAGFEYNGCFSRADVLVPVGEEWDLIEVKSSSDVKDIYVHDLSFQKYVLEKNGLRIRNCYVLHLSKEYVRRGDLDLNELFVKADISSEVNLTMEGIEERIEKVRNIMVSDKEPEPGLFSKSLFKGYHDCVNDGCIDLEENHVFCLYRGNRLACDLYLEGIKSIKEIPDHVKLNDKQEIQRNCEIEGKIHFDKLKIKEFIDSFEYPSYYLDFETFSTAIPKFEGSKCYQQIPFQFSLHVVEKEGEEPKHYEFLYSGNSDPREEFASALKEVIGEKGSVIVYYQSFEKGRLEETAEFLPEHREWIKNVLNRIVDLWAPFMKFYYYNPKQEGSASIKKVLPALTDLSYKGMEIANGGDASAQFYNMAYNNGKDVRDALLKYCELDTLAEVLIVKKLGEIVGERS